MEGDWIREWWSERPELIPMNLRIALVDEKIVGYLQAHEEGDVLNIADESCVHPDFRGRGIGSQFVELAESWARERHIPRLHMHAVTDEARELYQARGFELVRFFWRMEIDLVEEPPPPNVPSGFFIRGYEPGVDDEALHAMNQEAFAEHWEFVPQRIDSWMSWRTSRSDYDPALWQLAIHGDEIAGAALSFGSRGLGWILDLAVGSDWRKQGLGLALLRAAFRELHARGFTHVGLEVDSENETGATRLYERAGMRVTRRYATFEKQLA